MATYKHLRSSTANKRPTTSIADGQLAINTNSASPGLFFKDSTGATIIKVGPVHVGTTAPNATPGAGGSSGNSTGEVWLDTSLTPVGVKIWNGSAWVNGTPIGSTTVQGLLELATDVETQAGSDTARAVTPSSLQSKVSDSTSTTSSTTIASSTAVKSAFDLANAALPKSGGTVTGNLEIGTTGSLTFEGSVADGFETTIAVTNPTADRTITLPDQTGNMLVSGNASIVNADVNASAAIAGTKISPNFGGQTVQTTGIFSHALGSAGAPTITFTGDTNTGIYSPGADQLAISTAGSGRLFVDASGNVGVGITPANNFHVSGGALTRMLVSSTSAGARTDIAFRNSASVVTSVIGFDGTNNEYDYRSGDLVFRYVGTETARLTSTGRLGVGTSSPVATFDVGGSTATSNGGLSNVNFYAGFTPTGGGNTFGGVLAGAGVNGNTPFIAASRNGAGTGLPLTFFTDGTERLRISSAGNVGIGTTSPAARLHVVSADNATTSLLSGATNAIRVTGNNTGIGGGTIEGVNAAASAFAPLFVGGSDLRFGISGTERARIDSSGRLLVGTSSARANLLDGSRSAVFQVEGTVPDNSTISVIRNAANNGQPSIYLGKTRGASVGTNTVVVADDNLGNVQFLGADGTNLIVGASIGASVDGTPGANDMPGRLVFSTTADGASSPTERIRITQGGDVLIAKTTNDVDTQGIRLSSVGVGSFARDGGIPLFVNRGTDDGGLVVFRQAGVDEGSISVSGTTVSYNGAHLSRWSQLPSSQERTEILRGTVLSNIDEMCEWGDEDNEQLNRMKVSDVEGDKNVSGVFQDWDDDDDTYTDDFYCAMTGDFIIRIAEGVTVERGDLLMSAGDGTAKPQDDDIIRSKTIAKVTSVNVSCTYEDGSYCVPCVLMAC